MEIYKTTYNKNYEVSNLGNVRNLKTNKILKPTIDTRGYLYVGLYSDKIHKKIRIHRLVSETFLEVPKGMVINHLNGIKIDNRLENLEVCSQSDNILHAKSLGLLTKRGKQKNNKFKKYIDNIYVSKKWKSVSLFYESLILNIVSGL